ncbi:MAG TPA: hypothetical protein QGG37_08875 [Chloroflexota bacterium]|nr:hypothetical protein [Chloroflexota bacterium]
MSSGDRIGVGLIGCGLMAQTIHGRYLRELEDQIAITAVADLSEEQAGYVGDMFNVPPRYVDYNDLLAGFGGAATRADRQACHQRRRRIPHWPVRPPGRSRDGDPARSRPGLRQGGRRLLH